MILDQYDEFTTKIPILYKDAAQPSIQYLANVFPQIAWEHTSVFQELQVRILFKGAHHSKGVYYHLTEFQIIKDTQEITIFSRIAKEFQERKEYEFKGYSRNYQVD